MLACHDSSSEPLSQKVLSRPRLIERIRSQIDDPTATHMRCFTATHLERTLAVRLGVPLYACDPALAHLGDKSHGREIMREAGVNIPDGVEHLGGLDFDATLYGFVIEQIVDEYDQLDPQQPSVRAAVQRLREECVAAKIALSTDTDATIHAVYLVRTAAPTVALQASSQRVVGEPWRRPRSVSTTTAQASAVCSDSLLT